MDFLRPFVLPVEARAAERAGALDLYPPDDTTHPRPAVLVVHGGPVPAALEPAPRDWPVYRGYPTLLAGHGVVGATVAHRLHGPDAYPTAAEDVRLAAERLRADPRVDGDRIALWCFSGGALLAGDWLRDPPAWLRAVALSYPVLAPLPGLPVESRFRPVDAIAAAGERKAREPDGGPKIVLTRVGLEDPGIAEGVRAFVSAAAKARLEIIDVPDHRHGFDHLDDDDVSRAAIRKAVDLVLTELG
jgi:dienelactone hydrolase